MHTTQQLLGTFDFKQLNSPDFKEDSVREVIILPILKQLGYAQHDILRSKSLLHPFLKVGSVKRPITLEDIGERVGSDGWRLRKKGQTSLML
ncbi:MAG: hypothetical protein KGZ58_07685 [Ignavibacteriales bacterium]|nr:hypothetical protein [Ignavibacteriales bacterium]